MNPIPGTYKSFLDTVAGEYSEIIENGASELIAHFKPAQPIAFSFAPTTFLLDFTTKKYLYVEDSCCNLLGYSAQYFLETGLDEYLGKWHPADFNIINSLVFKDNMSFLGCLPSNTHLDEYIFSYNYRMKNSEGCYLTILQRFSYVAASEGNMPIGMVGVIFDISHYKTDKSIVHTIEKVIKGSQGKTLDLLYKKKHPVSDLESNNALSKREQEVLAYISRGLSSKQVAHEIGVSINTINNHRRNMLLKTGCSSSSELIHYALKHGFI